MNATKTEATIQSVKALQNEINAWEGRLSSVKAEVESLRRQKEVLVSDIEKSKELHNREIEDKHNAVRKANSVLSDQQSKLEDDKKSFEEILLQFKKDRNAFEREKQESLDMKMDAKKTLDRVGAFIVAVRNEAAKL